MRMAQLSEATGVPVPTIKFYIRDGLLPRGESTARNQASYGPEHVARIRLIRALTGICGLPLEGTARKVMSSIDGQTVSGALSAVADHAPKIGDVVRLAEQLGVAFDRAHLDVFQQAAEALENAENSTCFNVQAGAAEIVLITLLGDALILAVRNQIRTGMSS